MTKPKGAKRKIDEALRRQWLCEEAPFRVITIDELEPVYKGRKIEWVEAGVTHCVIGKSGYPWRTFTAVDFNYTPQHYADELNDESLLAIMTEGTEAEKLI